MAKDPSRVSGSSEEVAFTRGVARKPSVMPANAKKPPSAAGPAAAGQARFPADRSEAASKRRPPETG